MLTFRVPLLAALLAASVCAQSVYIGTYTSKGSKGIYRATFDPSKGTLSAPELVAETADPSFLAPHPSKPFLYAVNEQAKGAVSSFAIESSGKLAFLNKQETGGADPCHLALDSTGHILVVANYTGGSVASFPVGDDGKIGPRASLIALSGSGPNKSRQASPHAHSVNFVNATNLLVDDLGSDRTIAFRADAVTARLTETSAAGPTANPGSGPRHLALSPASHLVYVLNEIDSSVTRFRMGPSFALGQKLDTVSALPAGFQGENTAAEIALSADGRHLYTSNRGNDSIAVFDVAGNGALKLAQTIPSGGKTPRSFTLDPSGHWLLTAHQNSNDIYVFRVAPQTGRLTRAGASISVPAPVCLLFKSR